MLNTDQLYFFQIIRIFVFLIWMQIMSGTKTRIASYPSHNRIGNVSKYIFGTFRRMWLAAEWCFASTFSGGKFSKIKNIILLLSSVLDKFRSARCSFTSVKLHLSLRNLSRTPKYHEHGNYITTWTVLATLVANLELRYDALRLCRKLFFCSFCFICDYF